MYSSYSPKPMSTMITSDKTTSTTTNLTPIDLDKRKTLLGMSAVAVGGILANTPLMSEAASDANASLSTGNIGQQSTPADLDIYLISIPGFKWETLRLVNRTDHAIAIERFRAGKLVFDGEIVDCNDACVQGVIELAPGTDRLVQFVHATTDILTSFTGEYLNVDEQIERLPAGTRVIRLQAIMIDSAAVLTLPSEAITA